MGDNSSRRIFIALCFLSLSLTQGEGCSCDTTRLRLGDQRYIEDVEGQSIFRSSSRDVSADIRCKAKGAQECFYVDLDSANLDSLVGNGQFVRAFSNKALQVQVSSKNGNFYVLDGRDFQQSTMTVNQRQNGPSIYGSIRTSTGVYNIESCDGNGGCNVAAFVSNDFFAQQESKDDAVRFGGK